MDDDKLLIPFSWKSKSDPSATMARGHESSKKALPYLRR